MITEAQMQKLRTMPGVQEIESEGMDEGRFFVHMVPGYDFRYDPHNVCRSKSFGGYREAASAIREANAHLRQKGTVVGNIVFGLSGLEYHGLRDDGVYIPYITVDSRGDRGHADAALVACQAETSNLLSSGYRVEIISSMVNPLTSKPRLKHSTSWAAPTAGLAAGR